MEVEIRENQRSSLRGSFRSECLDFVEGCSSMAEGERARVRDLAVIGVGGSVV